MNGPEPALLLMMAVISVILRINGAILIWTNRKNTHILPAVLLDILSPILCLASVSYAKVRQRSIFNRTIALLGAFLLSQIITGLIFIGLVFVMGTTMPSGRALGPMSDAGSFDVTQIFFLVFLSSTLTFLILLVIMPEKDPLDWFKGSRVASTNAISILGLALLILVSLVVRPNLGTSPPFMQRLDGIFDIILAVISIVIFAPLIEEIVFRGYLFDILGESLSPLVTIVITGLVFALLHFNVVNFIPLLAMGIFMGWLRNRSGSIIPALIFHSANNLFALVSVI